MALSNMDIFRILTLCTHNHEISFHLFVFPSIFFHQNVVVFTIRSFISLVKFIHKYYIVLYAIVNGIVFHSSLGHFIVSVQKFNRLLYADFLSCNFTEFTDRFCEFLVVSLHVCMLDHFCHVQSSVNSATLWTVAHQASLSIEFSTHKYQSGLPSSRGSSQPKDRTHVSCVSCIGKWVLYLESPVMSL